MYLFSSFSKNSCLKIATVKIALEVHYTDDYPDALPDLAINTIEGSLRQEEVDELLNELRRVVGHRLMSSLAVV